MGTYTHGEQREDVSLWVSCFRLNLAVSPCWTVLSAVLYLLLSLLSHTCALICCYSNLPSTCNPSVQTARHSVCVCFWSVTRIWSIFMDRTRRRRCNFAPVQRWHHFYSIPITDPELWWWMFKPPKPGSRATDQHCEISCKALRQSHQKQLHIRSVNLYWSEKLHWLTWTTEQLFFFFSFPPSPVAPHHILEQLI